MRSILCLALLLGISLLSGTASANGRAFPPDNCTTGSPFMAFTGVDGSNTFCNSGQDIFLNALPNCLTDQQVVFDGKSFICEDKTTTPTVPVCGANQFLTYNGTAFQCAAEQSGTASLATALAAGTITTHDLTQGTHTFNLSAPGLITATGYHWANLPSDPHNCSLRYVIRIDGAACSMAGDINWDNGVCGNNFIVSTSCTKLLTAGSHTITSDAATYNGGMVLNGAANEAVLNYVVTPLLPPQ